MEIMVNNKKMVGLMDTGSQVSIISENLFHTLFNPEELDPARHHYNLTALNGTPMPYLGIVRTKANIGEGDFDTILFIQRNLDVRHDFLIGMNIINKLNVFEAATPVEEKAAFIKYSGSSPTLIPANSSKIISAHCRDNITTSQLVEPINTGPAGLIVLTALVTPVKGQIKVSVMNPTDEDIIIQPKRRIGIVNSARVARVSVVETNLGEEINPETEFNWDELDVTELSQEQAETLRSLLKKNRDCFAMNQDELGLCNLFQHRITLTTDVPIAQPYRRIPQSQLQEVREHLDTLLKNDIIQPSFSPYAAPIVIVRKKDGSIRMCCDYRALNSKTIKDAYPLPRMEECIDCLAGAKFFSTLDLASGYHQTAMHPDDQHKTAFTTPFGLYSWSRLPFGLVNAPSQFSRVMQRVMSDQLFKTLVLYLDDLLIYSSDFDEQLKRLEQVFNRLREVGLKLRPDKCSFAKSSVKFLGHILTSDGLTTDPEKTRAVQDFPKPETMTSLRSFLGLCNYYRKFVPNFAKIAKPLNERLHSVKKKGKLQGWNEECDTAFQQLKDALCQTPVLGYADFDKPFILDVDASGDGLGAVLAQKIDGQTKVIAYASRGVSLSERNMKNYSSRKIELLGLKWAICDKFRNYLLGTPVTVYTDNNPLAHLKKAKLSAVEHRWVGEIAAFNITDILYRPGKENANADALSRYPVTDHTKDEGEELEYECYHVTAKHNPESLIAPSFPRPVALDTPSLVLEAISHQTLIPPLPTTQLTNGCIQATMSIPNPQNPTIPSQSNPVDTNNESPIDNVIMQQGNDPTIAAIIPFIRDGRVPSKTEKANMTNAEIALLKQKKRLRFKNQVLYRAAHSIEGETLQIILPDARKKEALRCAHELCGHQGVERSLALIKERYFWTDVTRDVTQHVKSCHRCQVAKLPPYPIHRPHGHLSANSPLEMISTDFSLMDRAEDGTETVLVITDIFSKWAMAIGVRDQTALTVCRALIENWFPIFGAPYKLHSDRGKGFEATVVHHLCHHYGVDKTKTTPYNPAGNGVTERYNRTLCQLLQCLSTEQKRKWPQYLKEVTYWYNATPHSSTGISPYMLLFGKPAPLPIDTVCDPGTCPTVPPSSAEEYLRDHLQRLNFLHCQASKRIEAGNIERDRRSNRGFDLQTGEKVLVKSHLPGRTKFNNRFKDEVHTVVAVPSPTCRYFLVRSDLSGHEFASTSSEMKKYVPEQTNPDVSVDSPGATLDDPGTSLGGSDDIPVSPDAAAAAVTPDATLGIPEDIPESPDDIPESPDDIPESPDDIPESPNDIPESLDATVEGPDVSLDNPDDAVEENPAAPGIMGSADSGNTHTQTHTPVHLSGRPRRNSRCPIKFQDYCVEIPGDF